MNWFIELRNGLQVSTVLENGDEYKEKAFIDQPL